jgi:hypothetical protein
MIYKQKFEAHIPVWDDDIINYVNDNQPEYWKRFEFKRYEYIRTFSCVNRITLMTVEEFNKIKNNLKYVDEKLIKRVPKLIKWDMAYLK